ncbi:hypothetical protein KC19_VG325400 [Ceratodon purpureus]|uniref:Secreted protein n=1 Tax=Ceratodon purpureus TaxID=3225 RepID=A0A8T0HVT4_CERPU|nr:hypothetical protein KC19_VG325400 [Ceratodon purpureus]
MMSFTTVAGIHATLATMMAVRSVATSSFHPLYQAGSILWTHSRTPVLQRCTRPWSPRRFCRELAWLILTLPIALPMEISWCRA